MISRIQILGDDEVLLSCFSEDRVRKQQQYYERFRSTAINTNLIGVVTGWVDQKDQRGGTIYRVRTVTGVNALVQIPPSKRAQAFALSVGSRIRFLCVGKPKDGQPVLYGTFIQKYK